MRYDGSRGWLIPAVSLIIMGYFIYHSIQGARGYRRMRQVEAEIVLAQQKADEIRAKKELLNRKVQALSTESLDLDMLEETSAQMLNMAPEGDQVILLSD